MNGATTAAETARILLSTPKEDECDLTKEWVAAGCMGGRLVKGEGWTVREIEPLVLKTSERTREVLAETEYAGSTIYQVADPKRWDAPRVEVAIESVEERGELTIVDFVVTDENIVWMGDGRPIDADDYAEWAKPTGSSADQ